MHSPPRKNWVPSTRSLAVEKIFRMIPVSVVAEQRNRVALDIPAQPAGTGGSSSIGSHRKSHGADDAADRSFKRPTQAVGGGPAPKKVAPDGAQ